MDAYTHVHIAMWLLINLYVHNILQQFFVIILFIYLIYKSLYIHFESLNNDEKYI